MNIYFDTEFTGLEPNCELISIGCVAEGGEIFYAEFTDYDINMCGDWVKENVISNLLLKEGNHNHNLSMIKPFDNNHLGNSSAAKGDTDLIREALMEWLYQFEFGNTDIQFVSDVCHYDFYLLCNQIFKGAFYLPQKINPACYDICQEIPAVIKALDPAAYNNTYNSFSYLSEDMRDAFDISREELCKRLNDGKIPEGVKHNSLYDAMVIKMIYDGIRRFK